MQHLSNKCTPMTALMWITRIQLLWFQVWKLTLFWKKATHQYSSIWVLNICSWEILSCQQDSHKMDSSLTVWKETVNWKKIEDKISDFGWANVWDKSFPFRPPLNPWYIFIQDRRFSVFLCALFPLGPYFSVSPSSPLVKHSLSLCEFDVSAKKRLFKLFMNIQKA